MADLPFQTKTKCHIENLQLCGEYIWFYCDKLYIFYFDTVSPMINQINNKLIKIKNIIMEDPYNDIFTYDIDRNTIIYTYFINSFAWAARRKCAKNIKNLGG